MNATSVASATAALVIEFAPFRLAAGVDEATLLRASATLQREFLERQPGYLRRELVRGANGDWADLVLWRDQEAADAAMQAAHGSGVCLEYFRLLEGTAHADPGAGVVHYRVVSVDHA